MNTGWEPLLQVVSCDLIPIMWGNAFSTPDYISKQTKILHYPSTPLHF